MLCTNPRCAAILLPAAILLLAACREEKVKETYLSGRPKTVHVYAGGDTSRQALRRVRTFYFNGNPETDARYHGGRLDGEHLTYWHNGQIKSRGTFVDGRKEGEWTYFYNKFSESSQGEYRDGSKEGTWTEFWENGSPKSRGAYGAGRKVGIWQSWDEAGNLALENSCFTANEEGRYLSYHGNGAEYEEYACRRGKPVGRYLRLDPEGDVLEKGGYDSLGRKQGVWERFHPGGKPAEKHTFSAGLWQDSAFVWDRAGRVVGKGFFEKGTGEMASFDSLGNRMEVTPYVENLQEGEAVAYHVSGAVKSRVLYRADKPVEIRKWHPNGVLAAEGQFEDGRKTGVWKRFDDKGMLLEKSTYSKGELHGERLIFDSGSGKLLRRQEYFHGYPARAYLPDGHPG